MTRKTTLRDVLLEQLRRTYYAESQIARELPRLLKSVSCERLKVAAQTGLARQDKQMRRLEEALGLLGQKPRGRRCSVVDSLLADASSALDEPLDTAALDAVFITLCQSWEHHAMAAYACMIAWAERLRLNEVAFWLRQTLLERENAGNLLREIAAEVESLVESRPVVSMDTLASVAPYATARHPRSNEPLRLPRLTMRSFGRHRWTGGNGWMHHRPAEI